MDSLTPSNMKGHQTDYRWVIVIFGYNLCTQGSKKKSYYRKFLTSFLHNLHRHSAKGITNFQRKSLSQPGSDRNPRSQHSSPQFYKLLQTLCSLAKNGQNRVLTINLTKNVIHSKDMFALELTILYI